jgi:hypothetical protein
MKAKVITRFQIMDGMQGMSLKQIQQAVRRRIDKGKERKVVGKKYGVDRQEEIEGIKNRALSQVAEYRKKTKTVFGRDFTGGN